MHLLYIHQHFTTPSGAGGTRSYEMARRLVDAGHQVTMVCGSYKGGDTGILTAFENGRRSGIVDGINVTEFDLSYSNSDGLLKRTRTFVRYALGASRIALTTKADMLFATTTPLTAGIPGILFKLFRRKPFVFEVRDLWPELPKAMGVIRNPAVLLLLSILEWMSYRTADRLIALAPGISEGIKKRGVSAERILIVPNGCDVSLFSESHNQLNGFEKIKDSDFVALFAGTHGHANGLDAVINAAAVLQNRNRLDIKIVLIGQGKLKAGLKEKVAKAALTNIIFYNEMPKKDLVGFMQRADIGIQCLLNVPAFYNGTSPNKFFDYLSAGLPVITNYPGWIANLIQRNKCGFVVSPDNAQAFADALQEAADNPQMLAEMAKNSAVLGKIQFDRNTLAEKWIDWVVDGRKQDEMVSDEKTV